MKCWARVDCTVLGWRYGYVCGEFLMESAQRHGYTDNPLGLSIGHCYQWQLGRIVLMGSMTMADVVESNKGVSGLKSDT